MLEKNRKLIQLMIKLKEEHDELNIYFCTDDKNEKLNIYFLNKKERKSLGYYFWNIKNNEWENSLKYKKI